LKYILYVWNRKDCSIASPVSGDNNQKKLSDSDFEHICRV